MSSPRQSGFTLPELLVAVAIISTLVMVLLSALRGMRERAEAVRCISNLRHLHLANSLYSSDHGQYVAASTDMYGSNLNRWHGERASRSQPFDGGSGPLAPYLGESGLIRRCASFKHDPDSSNPFEKSCGGYGYNASGIGSRIYVASGREARHQGMRASSIQAPGRTVMFSDTAFPQPYGTPDHLIEYSFVQPYYFVSRTPDGSLNESGPAMPSMHFRHNSRTHVVWADGHVSAETMETEYSPLFTAKQVGWIGGPDNQLFRP